MHQIQKFPTVENGRGRMTLFPHLKNLAPIEIDFQTKKFRP